MSRITKYALGGVTVAAAAALLLWSYRAHRAGLEAELKADQPVGSAATVTRGAGETIVKFDKEMQERVDIRTTPVAAVTKARQTVAYGHLEEDPARSFVLRAPVAGAVRQTGASWPEVGQTLADGARIGSIEPRLAVADRITLSDRLTTAKGDLLAGQAALAAAQSALARARALNADDKNVADRVVQEAEARVASEQAHVAAAGQSVKLIESALASMSSSALPLDLQRGGQVVEVMAHPGESLEAGAPVVRVVRFDRLLARVDVPAGETVTAGLTSATIAPLGYESRPLRGERIAVAAAIDPKTQGQPFLFRVADPSFLLRPGLSVTAYLDIPGAPRQGVTLPRAAILRQSGKAWVYVQTGADQFARREVNLEDEAAAGWFTRSLAPGDRVVTTGAQTLLSEEFKSQIQVGEENQ